MSSFLSVILAGKQVRTLRDPNVTAVVPNSGIPAGGNNITIYGSHLFGDVYVYFGTVLGTVVSNTSTEIVVTVPASAVTVGALGVIVHIAVTRIAPGGAFTPTPKVADQYKYLGPPIMKGSRPQVGPLAGGTPVVITGGGFVNGTTIKFGTSSATNIIVDSDTSIRATTPSGSTGVTQITATTPSGTSVTSSGSHYDYMPVPTITSMGTVSGPIVGGGSISITGTGFSSTNYATGAIVNFGAIPATNVVMVSSTNITATIPAQAAGVVDVRIVTPGGTSPIVSADSFNYWGTPIISSITPVYGPIAGGTTVTLTGSSFAPGSTVSFGGVAGTGVTVNSPTSITVTSPASTGAVDITVTNSGGTSATSSLDVFNYLPVPTITGLGTNSGPVAGGSSVAITGTGFIAGTIIKFGTTTATSITNSATSITAITPTLSAGVYHVTAITPGGTSATSTVDQFTYLTVISISSISPIAGPLIGGTSVSIVGTNFTSTANNVKFGNTAATSVTYNSPTSITAVSPSGLVGVVDVTVSNAGGTSATSVSDRFTYTTVPVVSSINPTAGLPAGGTSIVITGSNFTSGSTVTFGGTAAATVTVNSATSITATSPTKAASAVDVIVSTTGGSSATGSADIFTYIAAPTVTGISVSNGPTTGGTSVTVTGTNFLSGSVAKFGTSTATTTTTNSSTSITAVSPPGITGVCDITIVTSVGTSTVGGADQFTYQSIPTITGVTPIAGPIAGGTTVTIAGTNFISGATAKFGTTSATNVTLVSPTSITVTSPAGSAGSSNITVTTTAGISPVVTAGIFTYLGVPALSSISPIVGPSNGGISLTIVGSNFAAGATVNFGTTPSPSVIINSSTSITAIVPSGTVGACNVTVITSGGTSGTLQFTYQSIPTVSDVSPISGPTTGGTAISISGTNFTNAATVKVGATAATGVTFISSTSITAITPIGASVSDVTITTVSGVSATGSADHFTYLAAPTVSGISPNVGVIGGGATVAIVGTNFVSGSIVKFGTVLGTNITFNSSTSLTATSPAGSAGVSNVTVTTPGGTSAITSVDQFTYTTTSLPTITGMTPSGGMAISSPANIVITGQNFTGTTGITFGNTSASFTINSDTQITAVAPSLGVQVVNVTITNATGSSAPSVLSRFSYVSGTTTAGSGFGTWTPSLSSKSASVFDVANKRRAYDNIIEANSSTSPNLVIENINNNPTNYTVYDFYGNAVVKGAIPDYPVVTGPTDQVTGSTTITAVTTSLSTLPTVSYIEYKQGQFRVPNQSISNNTYGVVGQGSWIVYFATPFTQQNILGGVASVTLSGFTPVGYNGTYSGFYASLNSIVIQNVTDFGVVTIPGTSVATLPAAKAGVLSLTLPGGVPNIGDTLVITYATQSGNIQSGGLKLPVSGQCGVTNWIQAGIYPGSLTVGIIVGTVDQVPASAIVSFSIGATTSGDGLAATLSRWVGFALGGVVDNSQSQIGNGTSVVLPNFSTAGNGEIIIAVGGSNGIFQSTSGLTNFTTLPLNNISPSTVSYIAGYTQKGLSGPVNPNGTINWAYTTGFSQSICAISLVPITGGTTLSIAAPKNVLVGTGDTISGALASPLYVNSPINMISTWANNPADMNTTTGLGSSTQRTAVTSVYSNGQANELIINMHDYPLYALSAQFQTDLTAVATSFKGNGPTYGALYAVLFAEVQTYNDSTSTCTVGSFTGFTYNNVAHTATITYLNNQFFGQPTFVSGNNLYLTGITGISGLPLNTALPVASVSTSGTTNTVVISTVGFTIAGTWTSNTTNQLRASSQSAINNSLGANTATNGTFVSQLMTAYANSVTTIKTVYSQAKVALGLDGSGWTDGNTIDLTGYTSTVAGSDFVAFQQVHNYTYTNQTTPNIYTALTAAMNQLSAFSKPIMLAYLKVTDSLVSGAGSNAISAFVNFASVGLSDTSLSTFTDQGLFAINFMAGDYINYGAGLIAAEAFVNRRTSGRNNISMPPTSKGWKPGYYYVNLTTNGIGSTGSTWGDTVDEVTVLVARPSVGTANLPNVSELPNFDTQKDFGDDSSTGLDMYIHGFNAMGPERLSIRHADAPLVALSGNYGGGNGGLPNVETLLDLANGKLAAKDPLAPSAFYFDNAWADTTRKRSQLVNYPNDDIGSIHVGYNGGAVASGGSFTFSYNGGSPSTVPAIYNGVYTSTQYVGTTATCTAINTAQTLSVSNSSYGWPGSSGTPSYGYIQDSTGVWHNFTWATNAANVFGTVSISGSGTINNGATVVFSSLLAALMTTAGFPTNGFAAAWGNITYSINILLNQTTTGILSINTASIVGAPPTINGTYTLQVTPGVSPSGNFVFQYVDASAVTRTSSNIPYNAGLSTVLAAIQGMVGLAGATAIGALGPNDMIIITLPLGVANFTINTASLTNVTAYCNLGDFALSNRNAAVGSALTAYNSGSGNDYTWFEGLNEPDQNSYNWYEGGFNAIANQYAKLRAALKSGNTNARVVGPSFATNGPDGSILQPNSWIIDWVRAVRSAGQDVDGLSMHLYNGWNGQYQTIEGNLADIRTKLTSLPSPSLANIPFWNAEAGNIRLEFVNGRFIDPRRIANWLTTLYLGGERYGLPKENICIYYDTAHGDPQYMPFSANGDLFPQHAFYRTYSDEIFGKTWYSSNVKGPTSTALSCGTIGNKIYRVDVFGGSNGTTVIVTAQGIPSDTITLGVPDTGSVTYSDFQGNTSTVPVVSGQITIPISDLPTYIRLAATSYNSSLLTVIDVGNGVNAVTTDLALTSTASAGAISGSLTISPNVNSNQVTIPQPASFAIDGNYRTDGYLSIGNIPDYAFSASSGSSTINAYFQLQWATSKIMNQVIIRQLPPWTDIGPASAMTSGMLQYSINGTTWTNCPTVAGNHWDANGNYNNTTATSIKAAMGKEGKYLSFYDYNWVHHVRFSAAITATYLRLVVNGVTYGHFPDQASNASYNSINAFLRISEFVVM